MKSKRDILVITLILIIVVLAGVLLYFFLIQPAMNAQVINWANKGYSQAVIDILSQLKQNNYVVIPTGNGNQTIVLVPYQQPTA